MKLYILPICIILAMISIHYVPIFKENSFFIYLVFLDHSLKELRQLGTLQVKKNENNWIIKIICRVIGFIFIITFVKDPNDSWIVLAGYTLTSCLICVYLFYESLKEYQNP